MKSQLSLCHPSAGDLFLFSQLFFHAVKYPQRTTFHLHYFQACSSVVAMTFTLLRNHHHPPSPGLRSPCKTETVPVRWRLPTPSSRSSPTTTVLLSVPTNLTYLRYFIQVESYSICLFVTGLLPLAQLSSRFTDVVTCQNFFF